MRLKINLLFVLYLCLISCSNNNNVVVKLINIDVPLNEKCHFFTNYKLDTLTFERRIKIIKNTLTDTIIFGQGVLAPRQLGQQGYTKQGNRNDISLDLDYANPPADRICISTYKGKKSKGVLELELVLTNQ